MTKSGSTCTWPWEECHWTQGPFLSYDLIFFSFQWLKRPLRHHFCNYKVAIFLMCCGNVLAWVDLQIVHLAPCPPTPLFLQHATFRTKVTRRTWVCLNNYYYSEEVNHCFLTYYLSQDCFHRLIFFFRERVSLVLKTSLCLSPWLGERLPGFHPRNKASLP